jgi:tripartite-type tricarboxylate transporter receptor subunit TctC
MIGGKRRMELTRRSLMHLAGCAAAAPALRAQADDWPSRPIRIVVGTAPGGSPDIMSRLVGDKLAEKLGQSFIVENNSQGAGAVAQQLVAKSPPDGYTMLMMTAGYPPQMVLRKGMPFDPLDGFSFVTLVCGYPMVYAVRPDSPIKSFPDLLAQAKANPGRITYTINALGSIYHVLTKWIELEAGIELTPIPYRGTAAAVSDVLAGRVDLMVDAATSAFPRIQSGQLRMLALSSAQRYPLMPQAPVVAESLPKIEFMSWLGLAMAAGTPAPIVQRLNQEVRQALRLPDVQQRLVEGGNVASPSTPEEMREKVASEMARWRQVIETSGIKAE